LWRRLVDRIAWVYFRQGKLEEAYNLADMALIEVKSWETDDPITLASLYNTLGGIYWTRLRYQDAIESVGRSLAIYQNLEYQWGMAIALTNLGVLNFSIGKWQDSIKSLEMADEIRQEYGHHPERPINLINLGEALIASGDFLRARIVLENSLEISKRLGSEIYQAYTYLTLGHLNILDKKISEAEACLENGWHLLEPYSEHSEREAQYLRLKALTLLQKDDFTSGHEALRQALEIAEQGGYIAQKVDVLRTMGMINTRMGNHSLAENELLQSIELGNNPFIQAQGLCELGNLYIQKAKSNPQEEWVWWKKAENKLDQAISSFENLGARYDLQRAQSLRSTLLSKDPLADTTSPEDNPAVTALRRKLGIADGEWYQATILAISLIPNQQVDEEILFETIAFLVPLLIEFIKDKGGQTLRHPNGVIGIFGAPAAYEDDTERAVDTGMAITNFYAELYQQTQLPISIRIGISMGKIVAGWVNQDTSGEFLAAGHSLQIARNLAEVTSPSRIWVTQAVRNLTSFRFDYSPVPIELVETLEENIFFQLVGERDQVLPVRGLIGLKAVFVGRQPELTMMLNLAEFLFEETATGGMVWIEGEPGIGKSRLTRELETTLEPRGALVCRGSCNARRSDFAFSVFSDLLSDALDIQPNFTQQQITDQVKLKLGQWHKDFDELQPFIEMLVGTQPSGPLGEQLISLEPEQLRRQTFVALNRFFSKLTEQHPLVLILDDVHWIDSISADLLLYLSPLTFKYPVMIICTQRSSEPGTFEQTMARVRSLSAQRLLNLNLDPLSTQDCQLLLNHYLSGNKLDETLKTLIIQQSGGNPYFIEEFVRMLMEQDYLRMVQGSLEINQKWQMDHLNIPSSLETLIRARVDSLPISARHLLQVASVLGNRFIESLLAKVTERADTHHLLEVLRDRGMLIQTSEEGIWEFSHQMIEVIVYNTVLKAQRRILHLRAAQALEVQWSGSENEHADELAYHYGKAENYAKTLGYLILAGERAASRYANDASISNFEQASDMLSAVTNVTDTHRWRIINGLGEVYRFMGNYEASLITLQAGLEMLKDSSLSSTQLSSLYRLVGETYLSKGELEQAINYFMKGLEMIGDPNNLNSETEAARIYTRLGRVHFLKSDVEQAQYAAQKAEELAVKTNSLNTLAAAENVLGGIFWSKGDIPLAMAHTRKAMSFWQELGYTWGVAVTYNNLAILEANSGDWNAAAESFQKALALRLEMGDVEGIALAQNNIGNLAKDQGHLEQADAAYRASLTVSEPFQMHYHEAVSYNNLAQNLVLQERFDEAAAAAKKCQELALTLEARELLAEIKRIFAQIALAKNQLQEAEQIAREAIVVAQEINNTRHVSSATRVFTDILLEQGNPQEALRILRECWDQLHQNLDELETGRIHAQLAKLYLAVGDSNMTNENRKEAQRIFEYLGAQHDLAVLNNLS
jgi:predicted ATPase